MSRREHGRIGYWMNEWRFFVAFLLFMAFLILVFFGLFYASSFVAPAIVNGEIKDNGFSLVTASFDSPAITIQVTNVTYLMKIGDSLHTKTIYNSGNEYLVLANSTIGYGYYAQSGWFIWGNPP